MEEVEGLDAPVFGTIKLISKDNQTFEVDKKCAFISKLVKTSLENDDSASELNIPGVEGPILELVVKYMEYHKGTEPPVVEKPLRSKVMADNCKDRWDAEYIDALSSDDNQRLYQLILAANYMDIKALLHLGCAKVASLIKGMPLERIKTILAVKNKDGK